MTKQSIQAMMNKFSFAQMTSNSDGKTSGSGTSGIYLVFVGGVVGILGAISGLFMNSPGAATVLLYSTGIITTGAALLGYRKSKDGVVKLDSPDTETEILDKTEEPAA